MNPERYPERVLLTVTGLSPQIVTETLYAITQTQDEPFVPTRIVVISTEEGADRVRLELLPSGRDWCGRLCQEYGLSGLRFDNDDIYVIQDENGAPLADIRTVDQNSMVADQISEIVRDLTADPDCAIHASLAGGRKTMGYYLGYAMSLFGRPQDSLSHVLVDAGFENSREFFYPTREQSVIHDHNGRPMDASKAGIMLADIPFVRLRDGLPKELQQGKARFSETIDTAQKLYQPASLEIWPAESRIACNDISIDLTHAEMAFYMFVVNRALSGDNATHWTDAGWKRDYLDAFSQITSVNAADYCQAEEALTMQEDDPDKQYFEQRKSRTNTAIINRLGKVLAAPFLIQTIGKRPNSRYGITIDNEAIYINTQ